MTDTRQDILVVGARGRVGRELVRALNARGVTARALVRSGDAPRGTQAVVGDLRDAASLDRALDGMRAVFFVTPHAPDEEALGTRVIEAAARARVERIVFASAYHDDFASRLAFSLFVGMMGVFTHYGPKLRVERRVRTSRLSPVVLMPSNFFQNDELFRPEILAGRYPQPLGLRGVNRVDCADIGEAAARALTDARVEPGAYPLVGPDAALTGPDCAAIWARALGQAVAYEGDIAAWRELVEGRMAERERDDFGRTYTLFGRMRLPAKPREIAKCAAILGRAPRAYADYVADLARRWRA